MNTNQRKFRWKTTALFLIVVIGLTALFSSFVPWLATLSSLILMIGGIGFAAKPAMSAKIPILRNFSSDSLPHRIVIATPFVLYGFLLLALSQVTDSCELARG